jgi:hypothetical protein
LVVAKQIQSLRESLMGVIDQETIEVLTGIHGILEDVSAHLTTVYVRMSDHV